jgi:hypothetical protein
MKTVLLALALMAASCPAAEWVIVKGGMSPDKKLAVAVYPQKSEFIDEADGTVLLIDVKKQKKIGPLEEVDSTGGTWGKTTENVRSEWSADGVVLLVNFRTGRLMYSYQIYRVSGGRAFPLSLPADTTHPKGKIFDVLTTNSNAGATLSFSKHGKLIKNAYGYVPKEGYYDADYSKYGLQGAEEHGLLFEYDFQKDGSIKLTDITVGKDQ